MVVEVVAMVLKYTSPFNHRNHLMAVEVVTMVPTVNIHPHNHYSHWNLGCNDYFLNTHLLTTIRTHFTVVVVALILLYTSPFNHQNHLMAVVVVARWSVQPLTTIRTVRAMAVVAMVLKYTSPFNQQNRLVLVVV
jgi:hypothetical protein